ncbi:hypothetical protein ACO22_03531 [Paracoccidioides brasiliensis]|uniref:Uncharacterized protein n=1 Tax=Paracoccidioides brasiliensis TaxID=121759 RepID=A0A1D2JFL3_PARBR|nr:hypothetical protein ACO22_03531 [Paracoccidioides brasiliensis]
MSVIIPRGLSSAAGPTSTLLNRREESVKALRVAGSASDGRSDAPLQRLQELQEVHYEAALESKNVDRLNRMESLVDRFIKRGGTEVPDTLRPGSIESARVGKFISLMDVEPNPILPAPLRSQSLPGAQRALWLTVMTSSFLIDVSVLFHGIVCMPYSRFLSRQRLSPQAVLRMPLLGSHPVLVARRLLILGSFLQGIPPSSAGKLAGLTSDHQDIMNRVVRTASRLVTNDDELVTSLDGIECVMIASIAVVVAQMMGLDTGNTLSSIILEPETQDRIDPDYM